nr:hypothetical protein [Tanacetum cinerariifolium]
MASLADKAILSGTKNRPPMLEKDMYDSWRSRMELYMLNRQHGRMILESVEHGPLLWPSVTEDGFQVNTKFLNTLPPEWSKFVTDVKLPQASTYQSSPYTTSYHTPYFVSQESSSSNILISYPMNDTSSTVNHNSYMASAPQIDYAPIAHHPSESSSPKTGLVVQVFQKGDDPIDAINHMMSFLTSVVTFRIRRNIWKAKADDLDAYDSDCDELNSAKVALMANLSHYGLDNLAKTQSSAEQAFWFQYSVQTDEPNLSGTTIVEVPKELPKVSMVYSCLKRIKFHLASFDMVVKERTTATAITEGT